MAYFRGSYNENNDRMQISGRSGFITVQQSQKASNLLIVQGRAKRYPVWMNETSSGAFIGEKMFPKYAVRVVIAKGTCHVWIKRMGARRQSYNSRMYNGRSMPTSAYKKTSRGYTQYSGSIGPRL